MSEFVATAIDTTGIQPYIFGSNRLRENIGASYLAAQVTEHWAREALDALRALGHEVYAPPLTPASPSDAPHIEDGVIAAELVYAGGGNVVLLFADMDLARRFTRHLTAYALRAAPGLSVVAAHRTFEWVDNDNRLPAIVGDLVATDIDRRKRDRAPSAPLLGLGVTAACGSTGLPAVAMSDHHGVPGTSYPVSREIAAKLDAFPHANAALASALGISRAQAQALPYDLDNLGRTEGASSYVAVVHADGNNIGRRFIKAGQAHYRTNRDYIETVRGLSRTVRAASEAALRAVYRAVAGSIDKDGMVAGQFPASRWLDDAGRDHPYLPFRPLVYGGDDVTFVCDGRLGLALATLYLRAFEEEGRAAGEDFSACAGICVVKTHYPFARAYNLSEALCASAKRYVRQRKDGSVNGWFSALDWHIASAGPTESLSEVRAREYHVPDGHLEMRPVRLHLEGGEWRTWPGVRAVVEELRDGEEWRGRRNKVLALREALRQGSDEVQGFLQAYRLQLPELPGSAGHDAGRLAKTGWLNNVCGYFDAIEVLDFLVDPAQPAEEGGYDRV